MSVAQQGGDLVITCHSTHNFYDQCQFIAGLMGYDPTIYVGGADMGKHYFLLNEILGNLSQHSSLHEHDKVVITLGADGSCRAESSGYIDHETRQRMATKFEAARSLTPEDALTLFDRTVGEGIFEDYTTPLGQKTGGMGMLAQRAYAGGDMHLTFFPEDTMPGIWDDQPLERFKLNVEINQARGIPAPMATEAEHHGPVRSFFPHVIPGKP